MTRKEIANLARRAFESDEVAEYLSGKKDYSVPISRFVSASVPTDFEEIIRVGIFDYFNETKNDSIPKRYTKAIEQLLKGDCVDVWCAYSICWVQIRFELQNKSPFKIMLKELICKVSFALKQNKETLEACHIWQGKNRTSGLWQDVERSNRVLSNQYDVSFI